MERGSKREILAELVNPDAFDAPVQQLLAQLFLNAVRQHVRQRTVLPCRPRTQPGILDDLFGAVVGAPTVGVAQAAAARDAGRREVLIQPRLAGLDERPCRLRQFRTDEDMQSLFRRQARHAGEPRVGLDHAALCAGAVSRAPPQRRADGACCGHRRREI